MSENKNIEKVKPGRATACFLFPIIGVITYFSIKNEYPKKAKDYFLISALGTTVYASKAIYKKIKNQSL